MNENAKEVAERAELERKLIAGGKVSAESLRGLSLNALRVVANADFPASDRGDGYFSGDDIRDMDESCRSLGLGGIMPDRPVSSDGDNQTANDAPPPMPGTPEEWEKADAEISRKIYENPARSLGDILMSVVDIRAKSPLSATERALDFIQKHGAPKDEKPQSKSEQEA